METADPGQSPAGRAEIAGGAVRFAAALLGDALPGWAEWTLCAIVAAGRSGRAAGGCCGAGA
ncbi:hypothetical protein ACIP46_32495 [Streptomyces lavendulae]|uniref:hypothetical protein n=1 Tax=Streptomyces lavendulae TaxID=1914 RepID=UPI00382E8941